MDTKSQVFYLRKNARLLRKIKFLLFLVTGLVFFLNAANAAATVSSDAKTPPQNIPEYSISGTVSGYEWEDPLTAGIHLQKTFSSLNVSINGMETTTNEYGFYSISSLRGSSVLNTTLLGPWVFVVNDDVAPPGSLNVPDTFHVAYFRGGSIHNWNWARDDRSFMQGESNIFYHVNRIHDYLASFGVNMPLTIAHIYASSSVDAGAWGCSENGSIPSGCSVSYSLSNSSNISTSAALSSDVIYHEYIHNFLWLVRRGPLPAEDSAVDEGISDYFACSLNNNPVFAEGLVPDILLPPYPPPGCNCMRVCNGNYTYPRDAGPEYMSGVILSAALWDIRSRLGQATTDSLLVNAIRLRPGENLSDVEDAMLRVDNGNHASAICSSFAKHGINSSFCPPPDVTLISDDEKTAEGAGLVVVRGLNQEPCKEGEDCMKISNFGSTSPALDRTIQNVKKSVNNSIASAEQKSRSSTGNFFSLFFDFLRRLFGG